jgi:hypothetical protein
MRGKFGLAVLVMATAAWLVAESQAEAGRHRRRGGCGGCNTGCATGCDTGCAPVSADCCTAAPAMDDTTPAPPSAPASPSDAAPAPPAPTPDAGASAAEAPQAVQVTKASPSEGVYYSTNRRARRGFRR